MFMITASVGVLSVLHSSDYVLMQLVPLRVRCRKKNVLQLAGGVDFVLQERYVLQEVTN